MKNLILTLAIIISVSCNAQMKIIGLDDFSEDLSTGTYLKDLDYDLDKFVGTWKYQNGINTLIIKLEKIEKVYNEDYYADLLIGSYKYIKNYKSNHILSIQYKS